MPRFQLLTMNRIFSGLVFALSLGYLVPLFPLPWAISGGQAETLFLRESWIWGFGLLVFNLGGSILLFRVSRGWTWFALTFSVAQLVIWWRLSGLFATDNSNFMQFLTLKGRVILELLEHPDFKVRFVAFHQDVLAGVFYHVSVLWFATRLILTSRSHDKPSHESK